MYTALTILAILMGVAAAALGVAYWRYRLTPARMWKGRVFALVQELQTRRGSLRAATGVIEAHLSRVATEAFARHLRTVPTTRLAEYSGIGPATIGKLQEVGLRNLADVVNFRFESLPDVGQARANALRSAVLSLVREARSRFDAGGCPEAQEYRRQVDALRATEEELHTKQKRELAAVESALHDVFELFPFAREVTFLHFLFRIDVAPALAGLMARPLPAVPEVEAAQSPPPAPKPAPAPPAVPPVAAAVAAAPAVGGFPLPPLPPPPKPVPLTPPAPPPDLFRAELDAPTRTTANAQPTEPTGLPRMRALVGFGFMVAKTDGRVAQSERKAIRAFLDQLFGHDPNLRRNIDPLMEQFGKNTPTEGDALAMVRAQVPLAERMPVYRWAEQIADAAGGRNKKEREALARIETGLELGVRGQAPSPPPPAPARSPEPKAPTPPPTVPAASPARPQAEPDHRATLEIARETPLGPELIRRRFQSLTEKLDPARAAAFGPEFVQMAEQKRARIRAAAEALIAPFNEPLEKPVPPPPTDLRHNPDLDDVFGA